ncbi:RNase A-like domain-containing protein [Candidatus Amarobacter glycogenicus]|uniref:RNase A-like domain-containing protein n=1 Tax=Candidatus Amarobacter glycogenicus TaxID=3140699 RepID=UPI002A16D04B|nr:hypothetical protein [Dehalococcoidia bacterium]
MFPRRSWVLLAVAVGLLVAGLILQQFAGDGGASPPDVPDSELTPAATTGSFGLPGPSPTAGAGTATAPSAVTPATAQPTPSAATTAKSRDLSIDEARGGHTLARHVGKSDAELLARLKAEPDISAASTYTDRATAERVVAQVITKKRAEIEKWEARDGSRTNLALRLALGVVIGRSIEQGETRAVEVRDAVVVLRWTGTGWYVLTSYPEER